MLHRHAAQLLFTVLATAPGWATFPDAARGSAPAQPTWLPAKTGTSVNCNAGQTITKAINGLKPAAGYQQITISGACTESVSIPVGLSVALVSTTNANLAPPAGYTGPTIGVGGKLLLIGMTITGSSFTAIYFGGYSGAAGILQNVTIHGPGTGLQVSNGASVVLEPATIAVSGASAAINTYNQGVVEVDGNSSILSAGGDGIGCYGGGNITLNAGGGPIALSNNGGSGLNAEGCVVNVFGGNGYFVTVSGNKNAGLAANALTLLATSYAQITNNGADGIFGGVTSAISINGATTISDNAGSAIGSHNGTSVVFRSFAGGINTITESPGNTNALFECYQGGKIYTDTIAGVIQPAPTAQDQGCLQVGGP